MLISMTLNDKEIFCVRYEFNMMNVSQKTQFKKLFKEKKFYEIPNPIYRGWLGFMIAALCSEGNVFDNILAAKTITKITWSQGQRREGLMVQLELPSGTLPAQRTLLFSRTERRKGSIEERSRREEEREAKEKEKEEQIQEKQRKREEEKSFEMVKKEAAAAKKAEKAVKKQWRPKKGASNTRKPAKNAEKHARKLLNEILNSYPLWSPSLARI